MVGYEHGRHRRTSWLAGHDVAMMRLLPGVERSLDLAQSPGGIGEGNPVVGRQIDRLARSLKRLERGRPVVTGERVTSRA